jgi:rod shape-determining protein MreC
MTIDARDEVTKQRMIRVWFQALTSPVHNLMSTASGSSIGFFQNLARLRQASAENEKLRQRVSDLERDTVVLKSKTVGYERLRTILDLKEQAEYQVVTARVIARDPSAWHDSVIINRGSNNGIALNMPVVTGEGIVGRIVALSPVSAEIMLITDEKAAAGAIVGQIGSSNAYGSVRGLGKNGLLEMHYVSGLEKVNVGDRIITTGQDGIYPANLNVGNIVEVHSGTSTTTHTIYLKPNANLSSLQEVAILKYQAPKRTPPDQTLPNLDKEKK